MAGRSLRHSVHLRGFHFVMASGMALLVALFLATIAMATTLAFTVPFHTEFFPAIHYACTVNGLSPSGCLSLAREAGLYSSGVYAVVLAAVLWRRRSTAPMTSGEQNGEASPSQALFVTASLVIMSLHTAFLLLGPAYASRLNETEVYSHLVSLENLLLPLLLQLYVLARRDSPLQMPLLASLLIGMALSPYRAMVIALYLFGLLLPLALAIWERRRRGTGHWRELGCQAAMALLVGGALVLAGIQDTRMRSPTLLAYSEGLAELPPERPLPAEAARGAAKLRPAGVAQERGEAAPNRPTEKELMPPVDLANRLAQRVVFPLYQAAIAGHLADTGAALPSLSDQVLRKLRLGDTPNLEEFLFRRIYGGEGHGETTSLTYGEARAYFPGHPLLWMFAVPSLLVLAWWASARRGVECGTLFGLALWRSSFSGLFPILPALLLQSAGLWLLRRFPLRRWAKVTQILMGVSLTCALLFQAWTLASLLSGRRDVLYARFELEPGCWLAPNGRMSDNGEPVLDAVGEKQGFRMRTVVVAHHRTALLLALPHGKAAMPLLDAERAAIASISRCREAPDMAAAPTDVRLIDAHVVERSSNLLQLVIVLALALAVPWPRRFLRRRGAR